MSGYVGPIQPSVWLQGQKLKPEKNIPSIWLIQKSDVFLNTDTLCARLMCVHLILFLSLSFSIQLGKLGPTGRCGVEASLLHGPIRSLTYPVTPLQVLVRMIP